jgi:hypothetical protein
MKRSAIAFARGARVGVRMIRMSASVKTASNDPVNLLSRSRIRNRNRSARSPRSSNRFAGLLGDPGAGGVAGDPRDVHVAAVVLDHDENVEAAQEHGVDVGEIDREDRVGLRGQELSPGRPGPSGRRIETRILENCPDGRGGHGMAEADQLALDVESAWGAVAGLPRLRFPRPLAEPDVRLSPLRLSIGLMPLVRWSRSARRTGSWLLSSGSG